MISSKIAFQLTVLAIFVLLIMADHKNTLKLSKIDCKLSDIARKSVINESCSIRALSRFRSAINAEAYLLRPFDDVFVNMRIFKKNSFRYLPYMVNVTVKICQFIDGSDKSNFYAKFMINWINKYSNFNHSCPYSGRIFVRDLEPFAEKIPVFVQSGDYRLEIHFYEHNLKTWLATVRGYGTISVRPYVTQGLE